MTSLSNSISDVEVVPPNNVDAEKSILGCILTNPETLYDVMGDLSTDDFYDRVNRRIWVSIASLSKDGATVDVMSVVDRARLLGHGAEVTAYALSQTLLDACLPIRIRDYARMVLDASLLRRGASEGEKLYKASIRAEGPSQDVLGASVAALEKLMDTRGESGPITIGESLSPWIDQQSAPKKDVELTTGLRDLDEITGGWQRSDLIIFAARPGMGKTGFAAMALRALCARGRRCMLFSLEMGVRQCVTRLVAAECGIDVSAAQQNRLSADDLAKVADASTGIAYWDLLMDDTAGIHINQIVSRARRAHKKRPLDFIAIDYFQLIDGREGGSRGNRDTELGNVSRALKGLAKTLDIPVLLFAQLSREVERRTNKRPQLSDLRETGNAEQDADIVMFLMRPEYYGMQLDDGSSAEGLAQIIVSKHRNGQNAEFVCHFDGPSTRFSDYRSPFAGGEF